MLTLEHPRGTSAVSLKPSFDISTVPLMPITPYEAVGYLEDLQMLVCRHAWIGFTVGRTYQVRFSNHEFTEAFTRRKPHYDASAGAMYVKDHSCTLTGTDRCITIIDDHYMNHRFMEKPKPDEKYDHDTAMLWEIFDRPVVQDIADLMPEAVERNKARLATMELLADFTFYGGQIDYIARMGVKDYGLVAAQTGTGKTLMALALIQLKSAKRALIIAPQGTIKSSEDEESESPNAMTASQWVAEIRKYSPTRPVFELFCYEDYERILRENDGNMPFGIYISWYEALFQNGGQESVPNKWKDNELIIHMADIAGYSMRDPIPKFPFAPVEHRRPDSFWCDSIGKEVNGIRCLIKPCLSTLISHHFDMVCLDESQKVVKLSANITQMLIRMQSKYRWAFSATPIQNIIDDLVPILGWLAVPDWYKGGIKNAAFPYARGETTKFTETFRCVERDLTQEELNWAVALKTNRRAKKVKVEKASPVISAATRLLKIVRPTMAYISKAQCSSSYRPPIIKDVRVPLGSEQMKLYAYFLNRGNIKDTSNAQDRARKQGGILRNVCADPRGVSLANPDAPKVSSNFNPKTIAIMELIREFARKGDPFVLISSRLGQTNTYEALLKECGVKLSRIDSTTGADRQSYEANQFKQRLTQGCLFGIKCAAGYSFSECPNEIIASTEFYPGPLEQAYGRIDRVNSKYQTNIWCILYSASVEEIMWDTVAQKDDAAKTCLLGQRVPRNFKPVDASEILADTILAFQQNTKQGIPETDCALQWPTIRDEIRRHV